MDIRHLRYFLAVAETGSVSKAAQRCFIAQSALSSQIAALESELGSPLFVRSHRGMSLTAAGEILRPLAVRILDDIAHIQAQMDALRGLVRGRLQLGMVQVLPAELDIIGTIAEFHHKFTDVELIAQTGASTELAQAVADGGLDLALVAIDKPELPGSLTVHQICDEPLVAVMARSVDLPAEQRTIGVADLLRQGPFIHYREGTGLRRSVIAAMERAGVSVTARFQLDQLTDIIRLAALGVGVTIVPASALSETGHSDDATAFRALSLTDPQALHTINLVTPDSPSPAAKRFLALLVARRRVLSNRSQRSQLGI